jgi:hypothetical protein
MIGTVKPVTVDEIVPPADPGSRSVTSSACCPEPPKAQINDFGKHSFLIYKNCCKPRKLAATQIPSRRKTVFRTSPFIKLT